MLIKWGLGDVSSLVVNMDASSANSRLDWWKGDTWIVLHAVLRKPCKSAGHVHVGQGYPSTTFPDGPYSLL